jgi:hypothetical protein
VDVRSNFFRTISAVPGQNTNQCTINRGDTVVWTWFAPFHSVTADAGAFDSGIQNSPFTFQHTFNTAGVFGYHCSLHGIPGQFMFGVVDVIEPPCPGDLDGNRTVDINDLSTLLSNYGTLEGAALADGDLNGDGAVDLDDLTLLLSNFGATC